MRYVKLLTPLLAALIISAVAACGDDDDDVNPTPTAAPATTAAASETEQPDGATFPLTITDDAGVEVTLEAPPEAIVALAPSFVEVLFDLGAEDKIVAADENTDYPPEAESIPKISGFSPSIEGIAAYEPDVVLIFFDPGDLQTSLINLGIPTLFLATPPTIDGVYDQIRTLGVITGTEEEADAIVSQMETDIAAIVDGIEDADGPSLYFELDAALFTVGPGSFPDEIFNLLGATNIAQPTGEAYPQMSAEAIIAAEPDVIILADADFGETPETVAARPGWDATPAVQDSRVYGVPAALLSRPTVRLVDDIQMVADLLYPES